MRVGTAGDMVFVLASIDALGGVSYEEKRFPSLKEGRLETILGCDGLPGANDPRDIEAERARFGK